MSNNDTNNIAFVGTADNKFVGIFPDAAAAEVFLQNTPARKLHVLSTVVGDPSKTKVLNTFEGTKSTRTYNRIPTERTTTLTEGVLEMMEPGQSYQRGMFMEALPLPPASGRRW